MLQLFQVGATNPIIAQQVDLPRMFLSLARRMGERNAEDFLIQPRVVPDEEVQNRVADRELVPA